MSPQLERIDPGELAPPRGYSHGRLAPEGSRILFVAGQVAWDREARIVSEEFPDQFRRALANVLSVVREAGGVPEHVARLTIYVADRSEYLATTEAVGDAYRELMGDHYPAMALVEVQALLDPGAKVEIEATAALPPAASRPDSPTGDP